jgi:hypothetical protein
MCYAKQAGGKKDVVRAPQPRPIGSSVVALDHLPYALSTTSARAL